MCLHHIPNCPPLLALDKMLSRSSSFSDLSSIHVVETASSFLMRVQQEEEIRDGRGLEVYEDLSISHPLIPLEASNMYRKETS